jgi:hypothetical protein
LDRTNLSSADIVESAARRGAFNPNDIHVKSAFLATDPLAFGIARVYELPLNSPRIQVGVFNEAQAAADWLGVQLSKLTL